MSGRQWVAADAQPGIALLRRIPQELIDGGAAPPARVQRAGERVPQLRRAAFRAPDAFGGSKRPLPDAVYVSLRVLMGTPQVRARSGREVSGAADRPCRDRRRQLGAGEAAAQPRAEVS